MLGTVCFANLTADKASAKTSGDYQYVVTGKKKKTCAIRKYLGKDKDVVVPDKIDGYKVTRIGNRAFRYNDKIKSVKLPKHVTIIGESAFYCCSELKDITLSKKLHTIKKKAFYDCPLKEINIPQYVKSIGEDAFGAYEDTINAITVDNRNKTFDSRDNCNAIIKTSSNTLFLASNKTVIPDSVTAIGEGAFDGSTIEEINIPSGVTSIGDGAFSACRQLKEISIPSSVKKIGDIAFWYCYELEKINFSEGLTSIGKDAFFKCYGIKELRLPDSLETIGEGAFTTTRIESIYIPESLKKTDIFKTFNNSYATKISVAEGNKYYDSRDNCNAVIETSTNTLLLGSNNTTIPDSVTAIGAGAFWDCEELKEITIPAGIEKIEDNTFNCCLGLEKVILPEELISIGQGSFGRCESLKEINLPDSIENIGASAFESCESLESICIPKNLKKTNIAAIFSDPGYHNCDGPAPAVTKITVAEGNPYYDSRDNCNAVIETASNTLVLACKKTVIPKTVKVINGPFLNCDSNIVIPEGVEKIAEEAFYFQGNLEKVTLPSSLTGIGKDAFVDSGLKTINYRGSKAQWKKIKISMEKDDYNWLSDVKINYNYKG